MNLHWLEHVGTYPFRRPLRLDVDALPELVAVCGPNEQGKTTLLDVICAALRLEMPYRRGALANQFVMPGYIRAGWSTQEGEALVSEVAVDPTIGRHGKTEAILRAADTGRKIAGPLQSDYLKAIERRLGSLALHLATAYAVQDSRASSRSAFSFLTADKADRRKVLTEILTLSQYRLIEASASDARLALERGLTQLVARIAALTPVRGQIGETQDILARLGLDCQALEAELERAGETLKKAEAQLRAEETRRQEIAGLRATTVALEGTVSRIDTAMGDLDREIAGYEWVLADADNIVRAYERNIAIESRLVGLTQELRAAQAEDQAQHAAVRDAQREEAARQHRITQARAAEQLAQEHYQALLRAYTAEVQHTQARLTVDVAYQEERLSQAQRQLEIRQTVPCGGTGPFVTCQFLADALRAEQAIPGLTRDLGAAQAQLAEGPTTDVPPLEILNAETAQSKAIQDRLDAEAVPPVVISLPTGKWMDIQEQITALTAEQAQLTDRARKADLDVAEARRFDAKGRLDQLRRERATATTEHHRLTTKIRALERDLTAQGPYEFALKRVRELMTALQQTRIEQGRIEGQLASYQHQLAELTEAETRRPGLERDLADWSLIQAACAPTGIPTLKIDAAFPALNDLATMLLRECYGSHLYELQLVSQKDSADGTKRLETIEVMIRRGADWLPVELMASGGAAAIISETLALALGLYLSERTGIRYGLLARDEVTAPLDQERAPAYLNMLRRALQVGGYRRVLFVSHDPATIRMADARLRVEKGTVTVE